MKILEQIEKDLKNALLQKEGIKISTLRLLRAALQNREIELRPLKKEFDEEEIIRVIKKEVKKREEAIKIYEEAKRNDLIQKEKEELEILKKYLPQELSTEEIKKIIQEKIRFFEKGTNLGKIIGEVMKEVKGRADGGKVAALVREELEKKEN